MLSLSLKVIFVIALWLGSYVSVFADAETSELNRLLIELKSLERIIVIAEHAAQTNSRFKFDYQQLRSDLFMVQQGIEEHVNTVQRAPRSLPDIKAEY